MSNPIVFCDTECDGVHPGRKPWEIALIRRAETGQHEVSFFVDIDLSTADAFGLRVGRFYDRHPLGRVISGLEERVSWSGHPGFKNRPEAAQIVAQFTHGAYLVGAVPNFDAEVFDRLLREHELVPSWHHRLRCVETLTAGKFGVEIGGLADCAAKLGIEFDEAERHTALGDARAAMKVYDVVMGGG